MAKVHHYKTHLQPGKFYHIYNRAVGSDVLFKSDDNYLYFLKKYGEYLGKYVETYAYCLLNNHFHLLIRVNDDLPAAAVPGLSNLESLTNLEQQQPNHYELVSKQFRSLFIAYTLAFNKQQSRKGTLFQTPFKRSLVDNDDYFTKILYYIHANPQHHGLCRDFTKYSWSSYSGILSQKTSKLKREEVIDWFYGKAGFIDFHKQNQKLMEIEHLLIE